MGTTVPFSSPTKNGPVKCAKSPNRAEHLRQTCITATLDSN